MENELDTDSDFHDSEMMKMAAEAGGRATYLGMILSALVKIVLILALLLVALAYFGVLP